MKRVAEVVVVPTFSGRGVSLWRRNGGAPRYVHGWSTAKRGLDGHRPLAPGEVDAPCGWQTSPS